MMAAVGERRHAGPAPPPPKPRRVLGIEALVRYYLDHLRAHPWTELCAMLGIATGVALVFAVLVANTSIAGSVDQLVRGITGKATIEVAARADQGFDQRLLRYVAGTPGVSVAAPLLEQRVALQGPRGRRIVDFVGATPTLAALDGPVTRGFGTHGVGLTRALLLPTAVADAIGAQAGGTVTLDTGATAHRVNVALALGSDLLGPLAASPVAIAPLDYAQELTDRRGRLTRVLVRPRENQSERARENLTRRFGSILNVRPSDSEARLIRQAALPNDQSTSLFAGISALVGFLFAINAMLLTVPARRRMVADMRLQGFSAGQIGSMLAFQAVVLGVLSSGVGLVLGDQLSRRVFHSVPGYLSFAFPVGGQRVVTTAIVVLAIGAGMVGSLLAAARPLADVYRRKREDTKVNTSSTHVAESGRRSAVLFPLLGCALIGLAVVLVVLAPRATMLAIVALVGAMLCLMGTLMRALVKAVWAIVTRLTVGEAAGRAAVTPLVVAVSNLSERTTSRGIALAATVACAVFGSVAITGARLDLLRGLDQGAYGLTHSADLWIAPGGDENTLTTLGFASVPGTVAALRGTPEIRSVRTYQGSFFDYDERRVWAIGRPAGDRIIIPAGQVLAGDADTAVRRIRAGGWAAVSDAIVEDKGLRLGESFTLPTPSGRTRLRLAARITNVGWPPGTIIMNQRDFERGWLTREPTAIEVDLEPGTSPAEGAAIVRRSLPAGTPLTVQTAHQRWDLLRKNARQGLNRLTQISTLVLIGAIAATALAMSAMIFQRRASLAELRVQGLSFWQIWGSLLAETAFLLGFGCAIGAMFGLGGQYLLTRWLRLATGFPADYVPALGLAALTFGVVAAVALFVIAIPGYWAARVPPQARLTEG